MRAAVFHGPRDVRIEAVADPAPPARRGRARGDPRRDLRHGRRGMGSRPDSLSVRGRSRARVRGARGRRRQRASPPSKVATGSSRVRESRAGAAAGASATGRTCAPSTARSGFRSTAGSREYVTSPADDLPRRARRLRRRRGCHGSATRRCPARPLPSRATCGRPRRRDRSGRHRLVRRRRRITPCRGRPRCRGRHR